MGRSDSQGATLGNIKDVKQSGHDSKETYEGQIVKM